MIAGKKLGEFGGSGSEVEGEDGDGVLLLDLVELGPRVEFGVEMGGSY